MLPTTVSGKTLSRGLLDVLPRAGLIAVLAIFCFQIFRLFIDLVIWFLILAVKVQIVARDVRHHGWFRSVPPMSFRQSFRQRGELL